MMMCDIPNDYRMMSLWLMNIVYPTRMMAPFCFCFSHAADDIIDLVSIVCYRYDFLIFLYVVCFCSSLTFCFYLNYFISLAIQRDFVFPMSI